MTLGDVKNRREIRGSRVRMTPKSEEHSKIYPVPYSDGTMREKQRPPIYNPEDYAIWLKKWGKKSANGAISLYTASSMSDLMELSHPQINSYKDYRNPMMSSSGMEMTLRQFGSASELLTKLRSDLRLAYPSFVQEFVADPLDGVSLLLDLLRAVHLSQSNPAQTLSPASGAAPKLPLAVQRRAMLDELACLQCLLSCCARDAEAVRRVVGSSAGMFTLAVCIMSNVNKSRIAALQLLSKVCEPKSKGHSVVSEAMSTLRLRFGEPVRFRFLIGMLSSAGGQSELLTAGLKFLNTFLSTAGSAQKRLYLQAELEQAGFDIEAVRKNVGVNINSCDPIFDELDLWEKHYIDIESITIRMESAEKENDCLRGKLNLLEQKVQILQDEKGILISLDQCLRERCSELREEVQSLKSSQSADLSPHFEKNQEEPTPDDEGISSSERTPTPEEEIQQPSVYDIFPNDCTSIPPPRDHPDQDSEEETTIEEVIQELKDIISNEETENHNRENLKITQDRKRSEEAQMAGKLHTHLDINDYVLGSEYEIIPSNLLPQPPRRARSLMHLFVPAEDYGYCNREIFFDKESLTSEGSFSLVSVSRYCHPSVESGLEAPSVTKTIPAKPERHTSKTSIRRSESFMKSDNNLDKQLSHDRLSHSNTMTHQVCNRTEETPDRMNCKSLDRIGDGLGSFVDIVVTGQNNPKATPFLSKSDSGNVSSASVCKSVSNIYFSSNHQAAGSKLSVHSEEKQRMFLPSQGDQNEVLYYFPRVLEKRNSGSSGFLGGRGINNAGMYSGQVIDNHSYFSRSKEIIGSDCHSSGKLTDFPSGLY
ncbi:unnamed protein product [Phaedon cochleariae]|uniref:GBD/FH3 domain-containing protein n=1 Tax=Phaedon cochleariae TaxID=80249 RepID=A0A9P0DG07_PHACE|nr:unnamed protein product [Phaedon cochleariae]